MDDPLRRRSEDAAAGSDPGRGSRLARCAPPLALALAAFALRALPWRLVFDAGRLVFHDNDAYYHARRIFFREVAAALTNHQCQFTLVVNALANGGIDHRGIRANHR